MDKTIENPEIKEIVATRGPRWERNRKYYLKNTHQSLRSTLLNITLKQLVEFQVSKQLKNIHYRLRSLFIIGKYTRRM